MPSRAEKKSNIVVQVSRQMCCVLRKAKRARLTNADLSIGNSTSFSPPVYVNEHLYPKLKKLLAIAVKKEVRNEMEMGVVFQRKDIR